MRTENSIVINAELPRIFETAADLSQWPAILPHYRWVRYLERSPGWNRVIMAARRGWIPIRWASIQEIDADLREVRFHHLKSFTKGMDVVWSFTQSGPGVVVRISHTLDPRIPLVGDFISEKIIGDFFVRHVADQTLNHMKAYLESSRKPGQASAKTYVAE